MNPDKATAKRAVESSELAFDNGLKFTSIECNAVGQFICAAANTGRTIEKKSSNAMFGLEFLSSFNLFTHFNDKSTATFIPYQISTGQEKN